MAEGILRQRLDESGVDATVHSAGLLEAGRAASLPAVEVLSERGVDLSSHRSRTLVADAIRGADLVLGMARQHVREAVLLAPEGFGHTFTLKELVRRGEAVGPRAEDESIEQWLGRASAGRARSEIGGVSPADDVEDPIGQPRKMYERTAAELDDLLARLCDLIWGKSGA
jgi:protein-tyrosine phosphatase